MSEHRWRKHAKGYGDNWVTCETCGMSRMTGFQPGWPPYYVFFTEAGSEIPSRWYDHPACPGQRLTHAAKKGSQSP